MWNRSFASHRKLSFHTAETSRIKLILPEIHVLVYIAMLDCVTGIENGPFLAEREDRDLVIASTISERPSEVQTLEGSLLWTNNARYF